MLMHCYFFFHEQSHKSQYLVFPLWHISQFVAASFLDLGIFIHSSSPEIFLDGSAHAAFSISPHRFSVMFRSGSVRAFIESFSLCFF